MKRRKFKLILLSAFLVLSSYLNISAHETFLSEEDFYELDVDQFSYIFDPFEPVNRFTFNLNEIAYRNVIQPFADAYKVFTPDPIQKGASNFFYNLNYPVRFSSNLIQRRFRSMWVETVRFAINSTIGIVGITCPADKIDNFTPLKAEDIGQAIGSLGISEGPYLVLPLLGPSNLRDLGGLISGRVINPVKEPSSLINGWAWECRLTLSTFDFVNSSSEFLLKYNQLKEGAIDPYSSLKNGYTQYRRAAIAD